MSDYSVDVDEARENAERALLSFVDLDCEGGQVRALSSKIPCKWICKPSGGREFRALVGEPLEIYDIHGQLLFYDFVTTVGQGQRLWVRTSADKRLRRPVWALGLHWPFGPPGALEQALREADEQGLEPADKEHPDRLVCYSYPEVGLLVRDRQAKDGLAAINMEHIELDRGLWSPLDTVTGRESEKLAARSWKDAQEILPKPPDDDSAESLGRAIQAAGKEVVCRSLEIRRCVQKKLWWCAPATALMILDFHKFEPGDVQPCEFSSGINPGWGQECIAKLMGTTKTGTSLEKQLAFFNKHEGGVGSLQGSPSFTADPNEDPTFEQAKDEIDEGRPLKYGIATPSDSPHARCCAGWRTRCEDEELVVEQLYIVDPKKNSDGLYWEDFGIPTIRRDYVFVKKA